MSVVNLHNKILILTTTFNEESLLPVTMPCLMRVFDQDIVCIILDNCSDTPTRKYLHTLSHPQLKIEFLPQNIGKANAVNQWIAAHVLAANLPKAIVSMDSDILFSRRSFRYLVHAVGSIPDAGMIGMRWEKNRCNPEINLFLPSKRILGRENEVFKIKIPFLANVAGGIFAITGTVLRDYLHYELYPDSVGKIRYPDDVALFYKLKRAKLLSGYLNGAYATHLKSDETYII